MMPSQYGFRCEREWCLLSGVSVGCEPESGTPSHKLWDLRPRQP
jgi:hypothetical protein